MGSRNPNCIMSYDTPRTECEDLTEKAYRLVDPLREADHVTKLDAHILCEVYHIQDTENYMDKVQTQIKDLAKIIEDSQQHDTKLAIPRPNLEYNLGFKPVQEAHDLRLKQIISYFSNRAVEERVKHYAGDLKEKRDFTEHDQSIFDIFTDYVSKAHTLEKYIDNEQPRDLLSEALKLFAEDAGRLADTRLYFECALSIEQTKPLFLEMRQMELPLEVQNKVTASEIELSDLEKKVEKARTYSGALEIYNGNADRIGRIHSNMYNWLNNERTYKLISSNNRMTTKELIDVGIEHLPAAEELVDSGRIIKDREQRGNAIYLVFVSP